MTEDQRPAREATEGELFRLLVENVQDYAIFVLDVEGRVRSWNPGAERLLGFAEGEIVGRPADVFFTPEDIQAGIPHLEREKARAEGRGDDDRWHVRKDGSRFWAGGMMTPLWDEGGKLRGFAKIMRDRTEWKRAQATAEERDRLSAFGHDVGVALNKSDPLPEVLRQCAEAVVRHLHGAFARIWTLNEAENVLELRASAGLYTHLDGPHSRVPVGKFKIGLIAQERKPHLTNSVVGDPRVSDQEWARREGMVAFAGYPLIIDDRLVGVLALFARRPLSDHTLDALASVANEVALGIERKRAEEKLRAHRQWLQTTLSSIGDAVIATDTSGRVTFLNPVAQALTGWPQAEAEGTQLETLFRIVNEESRRPVENPVAKVLREGQVVGLANHTVLIARDGTEKPIDDSAAPIRDERGELQGVVLVFRDISERKQAEEEERRAQRRTQAILESITDAFCALDRDWRFTYVNHQAEALLGRSREGLLGKDHWEEYPDTLGTEVERNFRRAVAENVTVRFEFYFPPHDRWYEIHAYPSGAGLAVYFRDVGERRRAEQALRESEEKLRLLADTIPQLAWMARPDGHLFWYNQRWYEYTGTTPEQMEGWGWQSVHDPETLPQVLHQWKRSIDSGERFDMVFPLRGADGRFRPFLTRVNPFRSEEGSILYWFGTNTDISEIKQMEEALRSSEGKFRQLADAMPQIVWTARADGFTDYYNRRWYEFLGEAEGVGEDAWKSVLHADDLEPCIEKWGDSLRGGTPFTMELRLHDRKARLHRWHLVRTVPVRDEAGRVARWYGTSTDIHEQKQATESARFLAKASAALATLVDFESTLQKVAKLAVPYFADWSAVDMANEDGSLRRLAVAHRDPARVELAHELLRRYPSRPGATSGTAHVLRTGQPEIVPEITDAMLVQGAKDEDHLRLMRALQLRSYICVPLVVAGKPIGVITFATAESGRGYTGHDLALAEDLSHRAAIAIENAQLYRALKDADRRKDEFLAVLAHELRNPLAPISNALQILQLTPITGQAAQVRDMMDRQVKQMTRLVDDLLDVSRIATGKVVLRKARLDLSEVILGALETSRPLIDAARHELTVTPPAVPLWVEGDKTRLAQVLSNLLTNAAKYTPEGGRIWLTVERQEAQALIRVRDNGVGIPADMLPRIFEMFTQVDRNLGRSQGGLGIGLTLVRSLVEMHGGAIEAFSGGPRQGSEFIVRLPLAERQPEPPCGETGRGGEPQSPDATPRRRILVVDDSVDSAESLAMMLKLQGNEVRTAHEGSSALQLAEAFVPHLVLLDIGLPGMDGYEVARRMRQMPVLKNAVLVAQTGWGQAEDRRRSTEAGFDHHLVKPVDPAVLRAILASLDAPAK